MCPYYILYGMTYDEYWNGDPWMTRTYAELYRIRQNQENSMLWVQGIYIYKAFETVMANSFRDKGKPPVQYLDKPLDIFPKTQEQIEAEQEQQQRKIAEMFTEWGKRFNEQHKEE